MGVSAGRVLLIPKGDWNAETTYTGLDWVRHNGATWVCKNTCTNIEPTEENSVNWQILARDGEAGTKITVDAEASDTSENPIQNKAIKKYVDEHTPEIDDMTGATADQNGAHGLVPAPKIGDEKKALLGDGTWGSVDAIFTYKTKEEYDTAVANGEIPDGAKVIKEYDEGDGVVIIDVDTQMSDSSTNPVQNKVVKAYVDSKQVDIAVATTDKAGIVKPDGITTSVDENGVIKCAVEAPEITVDSAVSDTSENPIQNKVIKKYVDEHSPNITVDSAMSDSSTNPIQNKVIKAYVDGKKVPTFERNNSIFAADQPFIVGANAGLITPTVKWYDDYGQRVSFKNTQDAQTSFLVYLNIPAHSVVLLNVFSINNEAILVKSRTTFYNPTDNADRANVQCLITVNGSCDINLDPLIIRNI